MSIFKSSLDFLDARLHFLLWFSLKAIRLNFKWKLGDCLVHIIYSSWMSLLKRVIMILICACVCVCVCVHVCMHSDMSDLLQTHGLQSSRLLCQGVFQARVLEWAAISYSRASSQPRDQTCITPMSLASPTLEGRFSTTVPSGKPDNIHSSNNRKENSRHIWSVQCGCLGIVGYDITSNELYYSPIDW